MLLRLQPSLVAVTIEPSLHQMEWPHLARPAQIEGSPMDEAAINDSLRASLSAACCTLHSDAALASEIELQGPLGLVADLILAAEHPPVRWVLPTLSPSFYTSAKRPRQPRCQPDGAGGHSEQDRMRHEAAAAAAVADDDDDDDDIAALQSGQQVPRGRDLGKGWGRAVEDASLVSDQLAAWQLETEAGPCPHHPPCIPAIIP
jgi:hypothetical protein